MPDIEAIQEELRASKLDGWLFYDFHHRDPIAYRVLGIEPGMCTRRWFYLIPAKGEPRKLVHKIEPRALDALPGEKFLYAGLHELMKGLPKLLGNAKRLAMQYSPKSAIPYVSMVDAGTVELIRGFRRMVVTSAELVQKFEARWAPDQFQTHIQAGRVIDGIMQQTFGQAASYVRQGKPLTEYALQQWIMEQFHANLLHTEDPPIVAVGPHSGDPHYAPQAGASSPIRQGDFLLLDMWAKTRAPGSVYYDITWTGYLGSEVPEKYTKIFDVVKGARDAAVNFVQEAVKTGRRIRGWQVDRAAREVIRKAGYGKYFVHRTGHSIGQDVHGNGANMDGLETQDDRSIVPHTCFSVEPGIYLPEFGVRTEVNVYVADRQARVTGAVQNQIIPILA
ncbi:MAG TPA: M24 family metallopeptidase [Terriglobia bacterium]